jgi:hypothetical protein
MDVVIIDAVVVSSSGNEIPQRGSKEPWGGAAGGVVSLGDKEGEVSSAMEKNDGGRAASNPIRVWGGYASRNKDHVLYCRKSDARGFLLVSNDQDRKGVHFSRQEDRYVSGIHRDAAFSICSSPIGMRCFRERSLNVEAFTRATPINVCVKHISGWV